MEKKQVSVVKLVDQITVDEAGNVGVRTATRYIDGKDTISQTFHRHVLAPGSDLKGQDERVARIAKAAWKD